MDIDSAAALVSSVQSRQRQLSSHYELPATDSPPWRDTRPASCPQAASISRPRFFRVIVMIPALRRISRNISIAVVLEVLPEVLIIMAG